MSWYNNQNQGFIDATQELPSGGGASQTELDEINDDIAELQEVFIPKQLNAENVSLDTIIVNNTANSRIFFKNQNTTPNIKIEGGKLYLYYTADITNAPTITSGWIDVDNYITATKDILIGLGLDLTLVNTYLFSPATIPPTPATLAGSFGMRDAQIAQLQIESLGHDANINSLDERVELVEFDSTYAVEEINLLEDRVSVLELNSQQPYDENVMFSGETLQNARQDLQNQNVSFAENIITNPNVSAVSIINSAGQSSAYTASIAQSIQNIGVVASLSITAYAQYILTTLGGLGLLGGLIYLWIDGTKEAELQKLETKINLAIEKLSKVSTADIAQNIHKEGLSIIENTNNNLFFVNDYTIGLSNGGVLIIEVKLVSSVPKAFIKDVKTIGSATFAVGNIINIPKTSLGSTNTGNLQIEITSLISERQILLNKLAEIQEQRGQINNRRRLRDGIINTDEIGDGLSITYDSTITNAETGEVLQVPTIKLKINTDQLKLLNGTLNINKYVNQDDIDIINGNIAVHDTEIVDINQSLERVYKVILPDGATMTSDYKLNLGYKEIFTGYACDLMMLAVNKNTYTTFSADNYNFDYLGYFPNMARVAMTGDIKVIGQSLLTVNTTDQFTKGFIFLKNSSEFSTFNLNRQFEFLCFLKFVSFNNNTTDYHILQSGVDLGTQIDIDTTRLGLWIRNRKLKFQHPALVEYMEYQINPTNVLTRYIVNNNYFRNGTDDDNIYILAEQTSFNPDEYKYNFNLKGNPYYTLYNNLTTLIRIINDAYTTEQNEDTNYIIFYLSHPNDPSRPIANCFYPLLEYLIDYPNVVANPPTYIKRITIKFDILFNTQTSAGDQYPQMTQQSYADTVAKCDFTFRFIYSFDGMNQIQHNFTMADVNPTFTTTGTTYFDGWGGSIGGGQTYFPKRYWTYSFDIVGTYPNVGQKIRVLNFNLIAKPNAVYQYGTNASNRYNNQPMLYLFKYIIQDYNTTETPKQAIFKNYTTTDTSLALASGIFNNRFYLLNLQLDLPNNSIVYYLDGTYYNFSARITNKIYSTDVAFPDPTIPFFNANFVSWANLTQDNSVLVVGNIPSTGSVQFSHFNWRFFQNTEQFFTVAEMNKLKELIPFNYYYDYVSVDKLLDTNEISANNITTRQLVINNNPLVANFTSATRSRDLRSDQTQEAGNVLIEIGNLYVENPTNSGTLTYNLNTKRFTIGSGGSGIGTRSEEDAIILGFIEDSAGTGLSWNATNNTLNVIPESLWQDLTPIYTLISANDQNVSNYVWETSNYLKSQIDNIPPPTPPYDDTAVYTQITTTSNILLTDFVARDAVLKTDYIARDDIITADSIERDDNLSASIDANKYTDAKVASYLSNYNNKLFNGYIGIGTTDPLSQLEIKGQYATLRIVDSDLGTGTTGIELIRGTGVYGSDGITDWRIENAQGLFRITKKVLNGFPDFLSIFTIFPSGLIGILNDAPIAPLTIGNSATDNTDGYLVIAKRTTGGASRHFRLGLNSAYDFTIGDFGNNNTAGTWLEQFKIAYDTPSNAFRISNGITTANSEFKISGTYKLQFDAGTPANPATISGGTGAKIIYYPSATTYPYSTGIGASALWNSIPSGATYRQYINGVEHLRTLVNQTVVSSTGENVNCILGLATPYTGTGKYGCAIIAEAYTSYSRANMCFCVNNSTDNFNSASLSNVRMKIWYFAYTEFYGTSTSGNNAFTFMSANYSYNIISTTAHLVCIKANGAIWATGVIATSSSREIKKDIEELDDQECLNKLLQLKPCKYRYIDSSKNLHPTKKVFGFIAEEVKEVLPEAVDDTLKELIPNIYTKGDAEGDILTISKALEVGVEYTCYGDDSNDAILITPLEDLGDGDYRINKTYDTKKKLLVYGKTIENFHALKKEYFHALCVSSIQEHHKIIMKQKEEITDLKDRLAKIEAIVSGMLSGSI
jgi:hypothetical protein